MKKYNYKYLIGFIMGILLCASSAYAAIMYTSNMISYDHTTSNLTSNNVQAAIDELATRYNISAPCPSDKVCGNLKSTLALGDYVSYTPKKNSYTTLTAKTGYGSEQTIYPRELNLWRVISLNQDGSVDIISVNVSSTKIYFQGQIGYQNFVGYLNELASQYENSTYTVGSRHFGYDNQTEYITDTTYFVIPAPWPCSTGGTCSPGPNDNEISGGGDTGYLKDYNQVGNVLGTRLANVVGTTTAANYWVASRYYDYSSSYYFGWTGRVMSGSDGFLSNGHIHYCISSSGYSTGGSSNSLRPIVTLRSGLSYYGLGTEDNPMEIQ